MSPGKFVIAVTVGDLLVVVYVVLVVVFIAHRWRAWSEEDSEDEDSLQQQGPVIDRAHDGDVPATAVISVARSRQAWRSPA